ncbi:hypothetical protein N7510_000003 [Penicillium lagena]|uniref:uncharacterized protein n=1 Tax=Penicillium lagena TaxID=94218 RepID=UPI0025402546|nr:uncharacterized protein N7510_000003 [Penicillium lagena]KAJ5623694.1 hypothetical protein N7510_000003 [Penicillium lagena]
MSSADYPILRFINEDPTAVSNRTDKFCSIRSHVTQWSWRNARYLPAKQDAAVRTAANEDDDETNIQKNSRGSYEGRLVTKHRRGHMIRGRGRTNTTRHQHRYIAEKASDESDRVQDLARSHVSVTELPLSTSDNLSRECFLALMEMDFSTHFKSMLMFRFDPPF